MKKHPLHAKIGELITEDKFPGCEILKDAACGGDQQVSLFCKDEKKMETRYCKVDMLICKDGKIRVIIEIDEANLRPIHLCGKFLVSAVSQYYKREDETKEMGETVLFIQILDESKLKRDGKAKKAQVKNIEDSIKRIISKKESKITQYKQYKSFWGNKHKFDDEQCMLKCIRGALK